MFAKNKSEYNWLNFLKEKDIAFNEIGNPYGEIKNNLFYVPKSMQFFYVCDFLTINEEDELTELANKEENSVVIAYTDGRFDIIHDTFDNGSYELKKSAFICECRACGNWWFGDNSSLYDCKACSAYDGDSYLSNVHFGIDKISFKKE